MIPSSVVARMEWLSRHGGLTVSREDQFVKHGQSKWQVELKISVLESTHIHCECPSLNGALGDACHKVNEFWNNLSGEDE